MEDEDGRGEPGGRAAPDPAAMAEDPTVISDAVREKIVEALNAKAPQAATCLCCGNGPLGIAAHFVTPTIIRPGGGVFVGGASYPQIMLICSNCGFTRYHNALVLGVYDV